MQVYAKSTVLLEQITQSLGSVWGTPGLLVEAGGILRCSCLDPISKNKPFSFLVGVKVETSNVILLRGAWVGKHRFSFLLQPYSKKRWLLPEINRHRSFWGECNCSTCREQLRQHVVTSEYLCRTDFYCNGILSLWVHCKNDMDVYRAFTVIMSETVFISSIHSVSVLLSFALPRIFFSSPHMSHSVLVDIFSSSVCICCQ